MIYDPARAAQELRQRILESMNADELEEYAKQLADNGKPAYASDQRSRYSAPKRSLGK